MLTVLVQSFSFLKNRCPEDTSGHGGGFVFDCRSLYNPGRLESCFHLTGKDAFVSNMLDNLEEVNNFMNNVQALVSQAVECCLKRDFASLTINFGCTGGQHRSVYCAERLTKYIKTSYPSIQLDVIHKEHNSWPKRSEC